VSGSIYFIGCAPLNAVKIGSVERGDIARRMSELQIGCPMDLSLLCHVASPERTERQIHAIFGPQRMRGEWFRYEGALRSFLDDLIGRYESSDPRAARAPQGLDLLAEIGPLEFDPVEFEDRLVASLRP
jgi:hypothetical protein